MSQAVGPNSGIYRCPNLIPLSFHILKDKNFNALRHARNIATLLLRGIYGGMRPTEAQKVS